MDEMKALSPLSSEEKTWANDDMKIVARNHFVKSSKQKCSQTWCTPQTPKDRGSTSAKPPRRQTTDRQVASPSPKTAQTPPERSRPALPGSRRSSRAQVRPESRKTDKRSTGARKRGENPSHQQGGDERPSSGNTVVSLTNGETTGPRRGPVQYAQQNRVACPSVTEPRPQGCRVNLDRARLPAHGETHDPPSGRPDPASEPAACEKVKEQRGKKREKRERPQDTGTVLCAESAAMSQRTPEDDVDGICPEHEPGIGETHDPLSDSSDLIGDSVYDGGALEKVKEKKSKKEKKREKGGIGEGAELPASQEGSEGQDAAGACVDIEVSQVDRTPGQTEEDGPEPSEKRRDLLSHDDSESAELFQDEDAVSQRNHNQPSEKKKKKKKDKSAVHVAMTEGVEKDKSVVPESLVSNDGREKRNKKRKTVGGMVDDRDATESSCDTVARPPDDEAETPAKRKKMRKEKRREIIREHEEEGSLNLNSESRLVELTGQVETSGSSAPTLRPGPGLCLGSTEMDQRASESTMAKDTEDFTEPRKKHKKKQVLSSNDDSRVGQEEGEGEEGDVDNAHSEGAITPDENSEQLRKKKKKKKQKKTSVEEEETNVAEVPQNTEINPKLNDSATCQKTAESSGAQYAEQKTLRKKQKVTTTKKSATHLSEDSAAERDDSASAQKNSAFLVADTMEKDTKTYQGTRAPPPIQLVPGKHKKIDTFALEEEPVEGVENVQESVPGSNDMSVEKKRHRKKKSSTPDDTVVKDYRDFDEPNTEYQSSVSEAKSDSEAVDAGLKRKRKHEKKDQEFETTVMREESAAEVEHSQTDVAVVLKKRRKYACAPVQEYAAAAVEPSTDGVTPEGKLCEPQLHTEEKKKKKKKGEKERNKPSPTLKGPAGEQAEVGVSEVESGGPVLSESNPVPPFETVCSPDRGKRETPKKSKRKLHDQKLDYLGRDRHDYRDDTLLA